MELERFDVSYGGARGSAARDKAVMEKAGSYVTTAGRKLTRGELNERR